MASYIKFGKDLEGRRTVEVIPVPPDVLRDFTRENKVAFVGDMSPEMMLQTTRYVRKYVKKPDTMHGEE
jgi:uncharacterized protein with von Willebrand factor type A (vWA) domain